jgi:hypothetical protein
MDVNDAFPGPGAINPRRPFPQFGAVTLNSPFAHATYHSLQGKVERRFDRGFSLLGSYTYSHGIDNSINGEDSIGAVSPQNPRDTRSEKASSATDVRHRLVTSAIWDIPFRRSGAGWSNALLRGWQIAGIATWQTGIPLTPTVAPNPANTTSPARADRLRDGNLPGDERSIDRWFDRTAFAPAAAFQYGNSGRHVLRSPGIATLDALVSRNFPIGERRRIEFRWELFNLTNTAQFGRPNLTVNIAQGGTITSTQIPNRQTQLGLRFVF